MNLAQRLTFSNRELTHQVRRLVATRLLMYLGAMSSYFIGVLGTLTYAMGASVGDNAVAVGLLNLCIVIGGLAGGSLLDRMGPHRHVRLCASLMVVSGLLYQALGTTVYGVFLGSALFGFAWGTTDVVARAYPAYLTGRVDELKRINAIITLTGNVAIVVGPVAGGVITTVVSTQAVFMFMVVCAALSLIPAWGIEALRDPSEADAPADGVARSEPIEGLVSPGASCGGGLCDMVDDGDASGAATGGADSIVVPMGPGAPHGDAMGALAAFVEDDGGAYAPGASSTGVAAGFSVIFGSSVLTLLFWATVLSFMGYGAFDPLESLFYRDVLKVGAEWMGWLSALSGVGGVAGAVLAGVLPARLVNVRSLLIVLAITGFGSLLYVGTPFVAVACAGQLLLGVAFSAFGPIKDTLVQLHAPLDCVGRVNAALNAGYNMAGAVPLLCAPALAHVLGVQGTLIAAGVLVAVVPLCILALRRRSLDALVQSERSTSR